jgi:DNA-directed RNA polymerase specialized sigma24 family protein
MSNFEPDRFWQEQIHKQILQHKATAFAELCELALPHLVVFLQQRFPQYESGLHEATAVDCLMHYYGRPTQYNPDKLSLFSYLRMAARNDMLNTLTRDGRDQHRLLEIDDPTLQPYLQEPNTFAQTDELDRWLGQHTHLSRQQILQALDQELSRTDKKLMTLMLNGVRDSRQYAAVMGLTHLDTGQQRREVKRAKDRITKKLQRFGAQLD